MISAQDRGSAIDDVLEAIVHRLPPAEGPDRDATLKGAAGGLVVMTSISAVVVLVRIVDGP